jgi:hypothetical protein
MHADTAPSAAHAQAVFCSVDLYMTGIGEAMMPHFELTSAQKTLLYIYIGRANGQAHQ